ncbi:hypothetical protein GCM10009749_29140 [Agromyces neolithicus]|uniref:Mercury transporter n=1 Tax=Agromyces neolithicus TaxID=269420 RepID=A0ABN2MAC0_9MICO
MTRKRAVRSTAGILGAGILACAACCAGPLLAFVGSLGAASLLGAYWVPALLAVTVAAGIILTVLLIRRRRAKACRLPASRVDVSIQPRAQDDSPVLSGSRPSAP